VIGALPLLFVIGCGQRTESNASASPEVQQARAKENVEQLLADKGDGVFDRA